MSYQFKVGDIVERRATDQDAYWCEHHTPGNKHLKVLEVRRDGYNQEVRLSGSTGHLGWWWDSERFLLVQTFRQAGSARATDPDTSKAAAKIKRTSLRDLIIFSFLHQIDTTPDDSYIVGFTGKELADITGKPLNSITPRFAELRRDGGLIDSGDRRDGQIVWVLA